jgi:methionine biosynthesis protein MetW
MYQSRIRQTDYQEILDIVAAGSKVLDLGCGDGELLRLLITERQVLGRGVEIDEAMIIASISKGLSVFQGNLNEGLRDYVSGSYDFVILNQTLQVVERPDLLIREMLRVGKRVIVSFPNFGYFRVRLKTLISGRMPVTRELPHRWYNSPNIHLCSRNDFVAYCRRNQIGILRETNITKRRRIGSWLANLRSAEVLFVIAAS